ncbi:hypothetical protein COO60DRAFT_657511 [Scenedesmus sp. NREL 46B-D3]|nr:hypothetical protein COO60DRAFT_657511 [Scenedesmus sp. NREL 46B-D3]
MASGRALARLLVSANCTGLRVSNAAALFAAGPGAYHRAAFSSSSSTSTSTSTSAGSGPAATSTIQPPLEHLLSSSSTVADAAADAAGTAASSFAAAQPLEPMAQLLNPFVLGSSIWELGHSMTGLPWWASIPATTLAMRFLLLPFTLKAKSAALNWVLLQNSFQTANNLLDQIKQQQQQGAAAAASSDKAMQAAGSLGQQQQQAAIEQLKPPSKLKLVRSYYRYFRKQQKTTSMWWWVANAAVQANTFVIMSVALRQMADSQWPGMAQQGLYWFTDLTQPSVLLSSLSCPYGCGRHAAAPGHGDPVPQDSPAVASCTLPWSEAAAGQRLRALLLPGLASAAGYAAVLGQQQHVLLRLAVSAVGSQGGARAGTAQHAAANAQGPREERERAEQEAATRASSSVAARTTASCASWQPATCREAGTSRRCSACSG